ncbi:hypothetical protein EON66_09825, partial [archaeon]
MQRCALFETACTVSNGGESRYELKCTPALTFDAGRRAFFPCARQLRARPPPAAYSTSLGSACLPSPFTYCFPTMRMRSAWVAAVACCACVSLPLVVATRGAHPARDKHDGSTTHRHTRGGNNIPHTFTTPVLGSVYYNASTRRYSFSPQFDRNGSLSLPPSPLSRTRLHFSPRSLNRHVHCRLPVVRRRLASCSNRHGAAG